MKQFDGIGEKKNVETRLDEVDECMCNRRWYLVSFVRISLFLSFLSYSYIIIRFLRWKNEQRVTSELRQMSSKYIYLRTGKVTRYT